MTLVRRKKSNKRQSKPIVTLTKLLFENIIALLLSDEYRTQSFITKVELFFDSVNTVHYKEDGDLSSYYYTILQLLRIIQDDGIRKSVNILDKILSAEKNVEDYREVLEPIVDDLVESPLDRDTAIYIENELVSRLNYISVNEKIEALRDTIHSLDAHDYDSYDEIIAKLNRTATDISKSIIAKTKATVTLGELTFDGSDQFKSTMHNIIRSINDEKRIIRTGLKRLNTFLNGGFLPGRVYVFNAISGGGKSVMLLNTIFWAMRYNKDITCFDKTKRPLALYITQENDIEETTDRIFSYIESRDSDGKISELDDTLNDLEAHSLLNGRWAMKVIYKPKGTLCPMDIDNIISEIESEGYEVKFIAHDYIKRLVPNFPVGDVRLDMGACVDDLSILAKARKIPIVTANQLNREAYRILGSDNIDKRTGKVKTTSDLGRKLDVSMISESQLVVENADLVIGYHQEETKDGSIFATFKKFKDRYSRSRRTSNTDYFVHPFVDGNGMKLEEDILLDESLSLSSIESKFGNLVEVETPDIFEDEE